MSAPVLQASLRLGLARTSSLRALLIGACVVAFAAAVALAEKRLELLGSATRTLQGGAFGFLIPLASFGVVGAILQQKRLDIVATPLARFGASRRLVALGLIASAMLSAGLLAASIAIVTAFFAHDPWAPPLLQDLLASAWIGALAGAAYGALFAFGSTFGARGGGRGFVLLLDFMLGGSLGVLATLAPRSHAMNLLGAPPPLEAMTQGASAAALLAMAVVGSLLAVFRCAR